MSDTAVLTPTAVMHQRLLAGEALNAMDMVRELRVSNSTLSKAVQTLINRGHEVEKVTVDGRSVWRVVRHEPVVETPPPPPPPALATETVSDKIRNRFIAGETLCPTEVGLELGTHAATLNSVRRSMERTGYVFAEERANPGSKKYIRVVASPGMATNGSSPEPVSASSAAPAPAASVSAVTADTDVQVGEVTQPPRKLRRLPGKTRTESIRQALLDGHELTVKEVVKQLGGHSANLGQVVKKLEEEGYIVTRTRIPDAGNCVTYRLADATEARSASRNGTKRVPSKAKAVPSNSEIVIVITDGTTAWMCALRGTTGTDNLPVLGSNVMIKMLSID